MITKAMRFVIQRPAGEDGSDNGGGAAVETGATGADGQDDAAIAAAEVEAEASKMGWTPKDQFKGDPAKWRPADEFVERGKNMLPIVQATVKRQERELADLRATVQDFAAHQSKTEQRAYERAVASLKAQRAEAVAAGDGVAFGKADEAIEDLRKDAQEKAAKAASKGNNNSDPVYDEWASRNKWLSDPEMEAEATALAGYLRASQKHKDVVGSEFLDLVTKEVKAKFPDKFENPRRAAAASVEGGVPAQRRGGKSYADMPADARAACDRMAKNGFGSDAKAAAEFKANYTKQFFEEA